MIRVLYLNHVAILGGAEYALIRLLEATDRTQVHPIVVLAEPGPLEDELRRINVDVRVIPLGSEIREIRKDTVGGLKGIGVGKVLAFSRYSRQVARFAKAERIDVIHTNSMKAHFYGGVSGRLAHIPVVWHIRDFIHESYLPPMAVKGVRLFARLLPARIIAVSKNVLEQVHAPQGKGRAIYDGLPRREFQGEVGKDFSAGWGKPIRIGIVGGLRRWKGQHIFLAAAAAVLQKGYNAEFLVVGGPLFGEEAYETELHCLSEALGIEDHVQFLGFRRDVDQILKGLDLLVHASTSADPCPNVILEGMAAGLPIIGSDGGGVPELLAEECGLLSPMGNALALAEAIMQLLDQPKEAAAMGGRAFKRVRAEFTSSRTAAGVLDVYASVAGTVHIR